MSTEDSTLQIQPDQEGDFLKSSLELVYNGPLGARRFPLHRTRLKLDLGPSLPLLQLRWMDGLLVFVNLRSEITLMHRRGPCASGEMEVGESLAWGGTHQLTLVDRALQNRATLECYSDPFYARVWPIDGSSIQIGRPGRRDNQIVLAHPTISREHATLVWEESQAALRCDGSSALTLVDGEKVEAGQSCRLPDGALLQLGSLLFQFRLLSQTPVQAGSVAQLHLTSLGSWKVRIGEYEVGEKEWRTQSARWLLARLAHEWGRPLSVETLCAEFWPDKSEDNACNNLNFCLSSLRQLLRPHSPLPDPFLRATGTLQLHPDWLGQHDLVTLRQSFKEAEQADPERRASLLSKALELYEGAYLPGCQMDWAILAGQQLEQSVLRWGRQLLQYWMEQGDFGRAVPLANQILTLEPCCPTCHRALLWAAQQQRCLPDLIRLYKSYQKVMQEQMELPPDESVTRLYETALQALS